MSLQRCATLYKRCVATGLKQLWLSLVWYVFGRTDSHVSEVEMRVDNTVWYVFGRTDSHVSIEVEMRVDNTAILQIRKYNKSKN